MRRWLPDEKLRCAPEWREPSDYLILTSSFFPGLAGSPAGEAYAENTGFGRIRAVKNSAALLAANHFPFGIVERRDDSQVRQRCFVPGKCLPAQHISAAGLIKARGNIRQVQRWRCLSAGLKPRDLNT